MKQDSLENMLDRSKFSRYVNKVKRKFLVPALSGMMALSGALYGTEKSAYAQTSNNSSYELVFPQFADGGDESTGMYRTIGKIVNPNKKPAKLKYSFRKGIDEVSVGIDGNLSSTFNQEITAGGSYTFTTDGVGNNGIVQNGSLKITSDIPVYATTMYESNNGKINRVSLPPAEKLTKHQLYAESNNLYRTGFAVDYEGEPTTIVHEIHGDGVLKATRSINVNGPTHYAMYVNELFKEFFQANKDFKGTHIIRTGNNKPFAVANLREKKGAGFSSLISTKGENTLYFPQIVNGNGFNLEMILQNLENFTQNVTVNFFKQDGNPNNLPPESYTVTLAPNGVHKFTTTGNNNLNVGWATARSNLEGRITGTAVYDLDNNQVSVSHSKPNIEHGMSAVIDYDKATGVAIANPNNKNAELTLVAVDNLGREAGRNQFVLASRSQTARFINEALNNLPKPFAGGFYVYSNNNVPVSLMQLDQSIDEIEGFFKISYSNAAAFNVGFDPAKARVNVKIEELRDNTVPKGLSTIQFGNNFVTTESGSATFFVPPGTYETNFINGNVLPFHRLVKEVRRNSDGQVFEVLEESRDNVGDNSSQVTVADLNDKNYIVKGIPNDFVGDKTASEVVFPDGRRFPLKQYTITENDFYWMISSANGGKLTKLKEPNVLGIYRKQISGPDADTKKTVNEVAAWTRDDKNMKFYDLYMQEGGSNPTHNYGEILVNGVANPSNASYMDGNGYIHHFDVHTSGDGGGAGETFYGMFEEIMEGMFKFNNPIRGDGASPYYFSTLDRNNKIPTKLPRTMIRTAEEGFTGWKFWKF